MAEYQAYLAEFAGSANAQRVDGRLVALQTAVPRTAPQESAAVRSSGGWDIYGGVSQYYWRNQQQLVHDGNPIVSSSGLLNLADLTAIRRGERFDVLMRANGAFQLNFVEYDDLGNTGWLSAGYIDVTDKQLNLQGRLGRQTRRSDGVLGRFDGAAISYRWKPDLSFSVSAGLPIESPRYISESHRAFYAAGIHFDNLWDKLDFSAYTHQQTVDGIYDRQAVGSELRYYNGPLNIVGLVDYDASYGVLNSALMNASWLLDNEWRVYGMFDIGARPFLTTRNALIGQDATSIEELLETYTEGQVRTLARDRTAQSYTASVGLSVPFWERFKLSVDVTTRQSDGTVESGGVAALPATGSQMFLQRNAGQ